MSTFSPNTPVTSRFFMDVGTNTLSVALCLYSKVLKSKSYYIINILNASINTAY